MKICITHKEDYPVSCWSGGKTTQLCIYPQESEYSKRNFLFRLSSATVECERSEFTALPGVSRIIMPLEGSLHLFYEGHGERMLAPYEQDSFDGGWNTVSIGQATDFNLMLREGAKGEILVHNLAAGEKLSLQNKQGEVLAVFAAEGSCRCITEQAEDSLPHKSLAFTLDEGKLCLSNETDAAAKVICVKVKLPQGNC